MMVSYPTSDSKQMKRKTVPRYPRCVKVAAWVPLQVPLANSEMPSLFQFEDWNIELWKEVEAVEYREFSARYLPNSRSDVGRHANSWLLDTNAILNALENESSTTRRESAAIAASVTAFTPVQKPRLLSSLKNYIESSLRVHNEDSLTAVGAAARKFGMNMESDGFNSFAMWFLQSDHRQIHPDLLMDLAKGVRWRFVFLELRRCEKHPRLVEALKKTVKQFCQSHSVDDKNYAAVRLELYLALIEVAAMQDELELVEDELSNLDQVNEKWFVDMLRKSLSDDVKRMDDRGNTAIADRIRKRTQLSD